MPLPEAFTIPTKGIKAATSLWLIVSLLNKEPIPFVSLSLLNELFASTLIEPFVVFNVVSWTPALTSDAIVFETATPSTATVPEPATSAIFALKFWVSSALISTFLPTLISPCFSPFVEFLPTIALTLFARTSTKTTPPTAAVPEALTPKLRDSTSIKSFALTTKVPSELM